jgi:hypothetical protein
MGGACRGSNTVTEGLFKILVERTERKKPTGRTRRGWNDIIKMYLA